MDPSATLGFYCRTREDFDKFVQHTEQVLGIPLDMCLDVMLICQLLTVQFVCFFFVESSVRIAASGKNVLLLSLPSPYFQESTSLCDMYRHMHFFQRPR